jgi:hypothetical protein
MLRGTLTLGTEKKEEEVEWLRFEVLKLQNGSLFLSGLSRESG